MLSFTFLLAGCDLFPRNRTEYLNRPVAMLEYNNGDKENITTERFISAFNSYGASLVQNGTSQEDALEQTLNVLINRYVLVHEAKLTVDISDKKQQVLEDTYDSIISNLDSFEEEVRNEWDIADAEVTEEESTSVKYTAYEPIAKVVYVDGEYKIEVIEEKETEQSTNFKDVDNVISAIKEIYYPDDAVSAKDKVKKETFRRYVAAIRNSEEGQNLSKDLDEVFARQVNKVYKSVEEDQYLTSLQEYYQTDDGYSLISVEQVLAKYKTLLLTSKFTYDNDGEAYTTAVLDSFDSVYYVTDNKFFNVSHILIKFDDAQKTAYDNLKTELDAGYIDYSEYKQKQNELIASIKANVRDTETGEIVSERSISANTVLANLQSELASCNNNDEKTEVFKKYIYTYNEDDGIMNADYAYVVGTEESRMVESFTDASRELHSQGEYGAISDLVVSEYGVHIIFYIGQVENLFTVDNVSTFNLQNSDIMKLAETKLNAFNNKTVFDKVYEQLSSDKYSMFESMNLNVLKKDIKITKYPDVYKNLD